ncbi:hypothetical protein HN51_000482 [Arachis hypogaea]
MEEGDAFTHVHFFTFEHLFFSRINCRHLHHHLNLQTLFFPLFHNKTLAEPTATTTTCATSSHNHNSPIPKLQQHQHPSLFFFSDDDEKPREDQSAALLKSTATPKPPAFATSYPTLFSIAVKKASTRPALRLSCHLPCPLLH